MILNIYCAECGTPLELAVKSNLPLQRGLVKEHPIALKPCPICANKNKGVEIARALLERTLAEAVKEKESEVTNGETNNRV